MIIVTGAAGFIGSCVVAKLNERGENHLLLVDHLENENKKANITNKSYDKYLDKKDFLEALNAGEFDGKIKGIIHMGACSSTTLDDAAYFQVNNFEYTLQLAKWCLINEVRFIYASSAATYGDGSCGYKDDDETIRRCEPLNLYGQSKQKFDLWALENYYLDKFVGLKFFNVFGPNEYHKGDMRSVVAKSYLKVATEGKIQLFKSYHPDYKDGEQRRDFIYVKDAVNVIMYFWDNPTINGVFNVGTGKSRTWNDLAKALFNAVGKEAVIDYIEMPENLKHKYQYFTQADMSKLCNTGYSQPFSELEDSVVDYVTYLKDNSFL